MKVSIVVANCCRELESYIYPTVYIPSHSYRYHNSLTPGKVRYICGAFIDVEQASKLAESLSSKSDVDIESFDMEPCEENDVVSARFALPPKGKTFEDNWNL